MTVIAQSAGTTAIQLNGQTSASGAINKPQSAASAVYAVHNSHIGPIFLKFGTSGSVTATASDLVIPPASYVFVDAGAGMTHAAVVAEGATTANVYLSPVYVQGRF